MKKPALFILSAAVAASSSVLLPAAPAFAQAYGPDTCINGFVWREATSEDRVCVLPAVREQASRDNSQARYRISRVNMHSGPNTCRTGYVWREAVPGDVVCVTPDVRAQARADNAVAVSRYMNQ